MTTVGLVLAVALPTVVLICAIVWPEASDAVDRQGLRRCRFRPRATVGPGEGPRSRGGDEPGLR
ncbi:Uncharacterised protein [Mycobacteroides abscessus subsp. abscessus]|nr:Uncharacterised protein [Mycobacteroides abscessus subsp. abscessus]